VKAIQQSSDSALQAARKEYERAVKASVASEHRAVLRERTLRAKLGESQGLCVQLTRRIATEATASAKQLSLLGKEVNKWEARARRYRALGADSLRQLKGIAIKKKRAIKAGQWDRRKSIVNMLSPEQTKQLAIRYVNSRIFLNGEYTEGTNRWNPQLVIKRGVSLNMNKGLLQDIYKWWLDEDGEPAHLQHRTTVSRVINARSDITSLELQT
jgi:hypothetical protein